MNAKTKRIGLMITLLILVAGFMGCNTWAGAGKDVEKAGEAMQK